MYKSTCTVYMYTDMTYINTYQLNKETCWDELIATSAALSKNSNSQWWLCEEQPPNT